MTNPVNMTIVDTNGKVLQRGTQGLRVVSEDGVHLFDLGEVSDDLVMNVFIHLGEKVREFGFLPRNEDSVSDLEILIAKDQL